MLGLSVIILFKSLLHVFCSLVFSAHNSSDGWLHLLKMLVIFISQEDIKTSIMCNIPKTQINKRFLNYSGSSDLEDFF